MNPRRLVSLLVVLCTVPAVTGVAASAPVRPHGPFAQGASAERIQALAADLEQQAAAVARDSFEHFRGWNGTISDQEQAILFKSEAFAASCRLFVRLAGGQSDFYRAENLRTNLYNAFTYLVRAQAELEQEMRRANLMPYGVADTRRTLNRIEREFAGWASPDNPVYLDGKYVQAADATVYLIERQGMAAYTRRPFQNLESLYRFNYDQKRGNDPWKYVVKISEDTLNRMRAAPPIALTFDGQMIIEQGTRPNRPVYRIENGKKRPLTSPEMVNRLGGWGRVFQVPREVIASYPDGDPIR